MGSLERKSEKGVMKQKHTKLQMVLEIAAILLILGIIAFLLFRWPSIPEQIAGHYNAAGQVDRWGDKGEILVLPIVAIALYGLLTAVSFFPFLWNVPTAITKDNKAGVYRRMKTMLIVLKVEMLAIFLFITVNSSMARPLPGWFFPVFLVLVFGSVIFSVIDICKYSQRSSK